jgi:hypothetical protein
VQDLTNVCAIDTTALTYTTCGATQPSTSPNLFAIQGADAAAFFVATASFGSTVRVTGARALVLVAGRTAAISGTLDLSANLSTSGPGAASGGLGAGKPADQAGDNNGGGGAGHRTDGARGAFSAAGTVTTSPGAGGPKYGTSADLVGGASGGLGNFSSASCGVGGGGGGALQLSALDAIQISGAILANGGGGGGGCSGHGGAGGGSGGLVFLESRGTLLISGNVVANGGGGGGGAPSNNAIGSSGQNGLPSGAVAFGGASTGAGGPGGSGGAGTLDPTTPASVLNAGGGGGAAGLVYFLATASAVIATGVVSPPASPAK